MNLSTIVKQLKKERKGVQKQLNKYNNAISIISRITGDKVEKRQFSPAAIRRIRAGQKKRWAKWHKEKEKKLVFISAGKKRGHWRRAA